MARVSKRSRPLQEAEAELERLATRSTAYPMRMLYLLMAVVAVESGDRSILATVIDDIKHTFHVSDAKMGILASAFSVVAALSVVPFGYLADRLKRVRIVALGLIPWALGMGWTSISTSFGMMFAARMLLGSIHGTTGPTAPSLLGDYYPVRRRSVVMGIFEIGSLLGFVLGLAVGGGVASAFGWRAAFFVWGCVGLLMALAVLRILPEPARGLPDAIHRVSDRVDRMRAALGSPADKATEAPEPSGGVDYRTITNRDAARAIARIPTFWIMNASVAVGFFLLAGLQTWAPTFFRRYHHLSAKGAGITTALLALSLVGGIVVGSRLGDRFLQRGWPEGRIWSSALATLAIAVFLVPAFAVGSLALSVPLFVAGGFAAGFPMGQSTAVMNLDILIPHLRGRAASIQSLVRVGMTALAPLVFGVLSDQVGLRSAFLIITPTMGLSGLIALFAVRTYRRDMLACQAEALRQCRIEDAETLIDLREPRRPSRQAPQPPTVGADHVGKGAEDVDGQAKRAPVELAVGAPEAAE